MSSRRPIFQPIYLYAGQPNSYVKPSYATHIIIIIFINHTLDMDKSVPALLVI